MRFAINSDSAMAQTWSGGSSGYAWHVPAFTPGVQPKVAVVPTMEDAFFVRKSPAAWLVLCTAACLCRASSPPSSHLCAAQETVSGLLVSCLLAAILWHSTSRS